MKLETAVDNYLRTALAKDECPNGHQYALGSYTIKNGRRNCIACKKAQMTRGWKRRSRTANGLPNRRIKYDQVVVRRVVAEARAAGLTIAQGARQIGCNPSYLGRRVWQETRRDVLLRDGHRCFRCGEMGGDVHHRVARGLGGASNPRISFGMDNLITLCRRCHDWAHGHPEMAKPHGWIILRGTDPRTVPADVHGRASAVLLTDDGDYQEVGP